MEIIFYAAILLAGFAAVQGHYKISAALLALGLFGPVAYMYWVSRDDELVYELLFRLALVGIGVFLVSRAVEFQSSESP